MMDCISREATINYFNNFEKKISSMPLMDVVDRLKEMPSVTPKQRIGKWIKSRDNYGNNHYTCPFCENDIATKADTLGDNYCSNCGAKLQEFEPQESEDKE